MPPIQPTYGIPGEALASLDSMEGVYSYPLIDLRPAAAKTAAPVVWPGYAIAGLVTAAAYGLHYFPAAPFRVGSGENVRYPVSASILAILIGLGVRNFARLPGSILETVKGLPRKVIPPSIVLTGASLNFAAVSKAGAPALLITLSCIAVAAVSAIWFGGLLKVWRKTAMLIGAGTAICGTSAIVAVAPLIEAEEQDVTLSIGTVNILGLLLMFALPVAGAALGLSSQAFGVWAGTSIHAVPQVVAAAFSYSQDAGSLATLVKLVRVAMLAPFVFALGIWSARQAGGAKARIHYSRLAPPFVWGFLLFAALNTLRMLPVLQFPFGTWPATTLITNGGELLLAFAMAAMGLEVNLAQMSRVGGRALLTGTMATVVLCAASLALIRLLL